MSANNRRQYGSGAVFQRKDGMWIGRFEAGVDRSGKRRTISVSAKTETRCKERLETRKREVARDGVPEKGATTRPTVEQWSKTWLDIAVTELRPAAYRSTASAVKVWIVPTIGRKRLDALTPADVRAVIKSQRQAGRKEGTVVRTHACLMKMLKDAVREDHYVRQSVLMFKTPQLGETDEMAMTVNEALAVLAVTARGESDVCDPADPTRWAAALLQAMRQGECLGLTRYCVDFDNHVIDISWQLQALPYIDNRQKELGFRVPPNYTHRQLVGGLHLVRPKSKKSQRIIPMVPWMESALRHLFETTPENEYGLVWPGADGRPRDVAADRNEWKAIQAKAKVEHPAGRPFKGHEARHTTATLLLDLGVDRRTVEAIMGHSKFVEAYDHSNTLPKTRAALEQLAEALALTS